MDPRERLAMGRVLVWRSLQVVAVSPTLLVYPVASWLAFVGSLAWLAAVASGRSVLAALVGDPGLGPWLWVADVAVALLGGAVLTTLFNVGLVHLSVRRLRDENPRLRDGLYAGLANWDRVVVWGLVSSTVGVLAHLLERLDPTGRAVGALVGDPWSPASFLALPVVAFEESAIRRLLVRSRQLYRKTWGYTTGASLGVDLALLPVGGALVVVGAYARLASLGALTESLLTAVAVVGLLAVLLVRQLAVGVSKAAVYIHATTDRTPRAYMGVDFSTVSWGRRAARD